MRALWEKFVVVVVVGVPSWFWCRCGLLVVVRVEDWFKVVVKGAVHLSVVGGGYALARLEKDSGAACWGGPGVAEEGLVPVLFVVVLLLLFVASLCGVLLVIVVGLTGVLIHDVIDSGPVEVGGRVRTVLAEEGAQLLQEKRSPSLVVMRSGGVYVRVLGEWCGDVVFPFM